MKMKMKLADAYLVLYNAVLAVGWSAILYYVLISFRFGPGEDRACTLYNTLCFETSTSQTIFDYLAIFQTAAVLEILHVLIKIVGGQVFTTFFQVFSRVALTWFICYVDARALNTATFYTMSFAWALTEVVRYNTYWLKIVLGTTPSILLWCRYTFFIVLYPLGVYSELVNNLHTIGYYSELKAEGKFEEESEENIYTERLSGQYHIIVYCLMLLYPLIFPQMYLYMFVQRKKHLGKKRPPPSTEGIQFPVDAKGKRSTSLFNQMAFAASLLPVDETKAFKVMAEKKWRFGYAKHVIDNVKACCASTQDCVKIAEAGLSFLYSNFEFIRDGKATSLREAMKKYTDTKYHTLTIKGSGTARGEYTVPYVRTAYPKESPELSLTGDALIEQLNKWVENGSIEPSAGEAIRMVAENKEWLDLSDKYFVLFGATSAMGPLDILLAHGANVICVDLNLPAIWKKLVAKARASAGTIIFPVTDASISADDDEAIVNNAGCNLFTDTPEIATWLKDLLPTKDFVVGSYAYLDGEKHVRLSIAMDAIINSILPARASKTSLAYLCSPTDVFVVDEETSGAAQQNYRRGGLAKAVGGLVKLFNKGALKKNFVEPAASSDGNTTYHINDGIVVAQGPNYALAKRIQHWRAMVARAYGVTVSSNIAPSTATLSVIHNASFKAAYGGFPYFFPFEVARQETSNAVMGALLIHDVCNPSAAARATQQIGNPVNLFKYGAFHGGVWRCGYKVGSIGETSALLYYLTSYGVQLVLGSGAAAAVYIYGVGGIVEKVMELANQSK